MNGEAPPSKAPRGRRRGNGEGSISKAKDGRYVARVSVGYVNGKRRRKAVYGRTRAEVARKLAALLKLRSDGAALPNERRRMNDLFDEWLREHVEKTLRPMTVRSYRLQTRRYLRAGLGKLVVARCTTDNIDRFLGALEKDGKSGAQRKYLRAVLRSAWRFAIKRGYATVDVVKYASVPMVARKRFEVFSQEEAVRFLKVVQPHRLRALFTFGLALGTRFGEVLGLRWSSVNFETGEVRIDAQLQALHEDEVNAHVIKHLVGSFHLVPPKSASGVRTIKVPAVALKALVEHRRAQSVERLKAGPKWHDLDLVFTTEIGTPCSDSNVRRVYKAFLKNAGIDERRFHDVRHATATLLLLQGVPPRVVQELLGHSDIRLTIETYGHVMESQTEAAAVAMDGLLSS